VNAKIVSVIYRKEMLELLRDRRTLISMVLVPLFALPVLFGVMSLVLAWRQKEAERDSYVIAVNPACGKSLDAVLASAGFRIKPEAGPRRAVENKAVAAAVDVNIVNGVRQYVVYSDRTRPSSSIAGERLSATLATWKEAAVRQSLRGSGISEQVLTPFTVRAVNVASQRKMTGLLLGGSLAYLVVLLMFTGAMYPAVDTTAGEKERRTLEALLCSPAGRNEIVLGKVLACAAASLLTAVLAMTSLIGSYRYMRFGIVPDAANFNPLEPHTISLILLSAAPLSLLAGSLMVAVSLFAKSYKEGQSYLTPLLMAVLFPAVLGTLPGLELTPTLALVPVFNVCQLIKGIFLGSVSTPAFLTACTANLGYATLAFAAATRIFRSEGVLFRV
jgi:sodium transport system permease protein